MTKQVSERVKLIEELHKENLWLDHTRIAAIADFILARDKKNYEDYEVLKEKAWMYDQLSK